MGGHNVAHASLWHQDSDIIQEILVKTLISFGISDDRNKGSVETNKLWKIALHGFLE